MKWFICLNNNNKYQRYAKIAINSALQNTNIEPHCVYDGYEDSFTKWLYQKNIPVYYKKSRFYNYIKKQELDINRISSEFLRFEIPEIIINNNIFDDFYLYTDCDVIFNSSIEELNKLKPFSIAWVSNSSISKTFNSGLMLVNVENMIKYQKKFEEALQVTSKNYLYDEYFYNLFFAKNSIELSSNFNWRPYWGINNDAKVIHFHRMKIDIIEKIINNKDNVEKLLITKFYNNVNSVKYYYDLAKKYEK